MTWLHEAEGQPPVAQFGRVGYHKRVNILPSKLRHISLTSSSRTLTRERSSGQLAYSKVTSLLILILHSWLGYMYRLHIIIVLHC